MGLRNRTKISEEQFYFVTTTVRNFTKVFINDDFCNILINNIKYYQNKYEFIILGYVIMPSHFHWIIKTEPEKGNISEIMRDIKKYTAWDVLEKLEKENQKLLETFRKGVKRGQKQQFWIHRFDDQAIRNDKMFWTKLKYIHDNPVKAGLSADVLDYKYSSARNYINQDHSVIFVDTTYAGVEVS
jgi:putative transposase